MDGQVCARVCDLSMGCHLVVVERLVCSSEPQSYVIWSLVLLVGLPLVNRFVVRIQTKHGPTPNHLWAGGKVDVSPGHHLDNTIPFISSLLDCRGLATLPVIIFPSSLALGASRPERLHTGIGIKFI